MGSRTLHAPWGRLGTGTTVIGADTAPHTIEWVRRDGWLVRVHFEDGGHEMHHELAAATVVLRVATSARPRRHPTPPDVVLLIARFLASREPAEIEALADDLAATRSTRAIRPLAARLGDSLVQDDPDLENAVCGALVALGAMCTSGNLNYRFRENSELTPEVSETLRSLRCAIPTRYLTRRS